MIMGKIKDKNLTSAVPDDVAKSFLPLIKNMEKGQRALASEK
jgi:hypothetical protein